MVYTLAEIVCLLLICLTLRSYANCLRNMTLMWETMTLLDSIHTEQTQLNVQS